MKLTINLITRGRPQLLLETVKRTIPNISRDDTVYMISIDNDDEATLAVVDEIKALDTRILISVKPREDAIGDKWSRALEVPADVYGMQGDYRPVSTSAFDQKILDAASVFPDGIGAVYTAMDNTSFPSTICVTHGLVQKLGYYMMGIYPYWFVDHHLKDILEIIDRIAYADVHFDYVAGKPPTTEQREVPFWATFFDCQRIKRRKEAHAIIDSPDFQEAPWRKELLKRHHPVIEYRSQSINDTVRAIFANDAAPADPGGARYQRVKLQAQTMMLELIPELEAEIGRVREAA